MAQLLPQPPTCSACGRVTSLPTYVFSAPYHLMCAPAYQVASPSKVWSAFLHGQSFANLPGEHTY